MADRTYLPWLDALDIMRRDGHPLYALESKKKVCEFDVVGITLQSELTFTNVLEFLDLSGIPIHSKDRTDIDPIVIAGGPCASNPLPLNSFIDAFLIGEGEDAIEEIAEVLRNNIRHGEFIEPCTLQQAQDDLPHRNDIPGESSAFLQKADKDSLLHGNDKELRNDILTKLSQIKGMYVPAVHDRIIGQDSSFRIKIRKYTGFTTNEKTHTPQLMPWQLATHNRYVAEIMRGCTRGCRFCHAGYFYRPVRERDPEQILDSLLKEIETYGWDEAGLVSLSSSDYSCIRPLLEALLKKIDQQKTHVSLPSLRVDSFDDTLVSLLREVGREGLTIAPEAGTQRLRNVVNKNLSEEEILGGVRIAKQLGWQRIKLYFMLGLPTETEADIQGIIDLINLIIGETGKKFQINVSLSPFVPKAHTPFQWVAMLAPEELLRRALLIKHTFQRAKFIKIRYHTIENSVLESVISRGDDSTAAWIEQAWKNGAIYDGWNESFKWENWTKAASETDYNYLSALNDLSVADSLPWEFIDLGVEKKWLAGEWEKARQEIPTIDCRTGCIACGVCDEETVMQTAVSNERFVKVMSALPMPSVKEAPGTKSTFINSWSYRLFYQKAGDFRFIGHLDWMRMVFRMMSRSRLDIVYTQGFNPHPKISFGPSLAVGVAGENEYLDLHTSVEYSTEELAAALNPLFVEGLRLNTILPKMKNEKDAQPVADELRIILPTEMISQAEGKLKEFEKMDTFPMTVIKKESERTYDLKQVIISMLLDYNILNITKLLHSPNIYKLLSIIFDVEKEKLYDWDISRIGFQA